MSDDYEDDFIHDEAAATASAQSHSHPSKPSLSRPQSILGPNNAASSASSSSSSSSSSRPSPTARQPSVSLSALKASYAAPIRSPANSGTTPPSSASSTASFSSLNINTSAAPSPSSSSSSSSSANNDSKRVNELENRVKELEREVSANRVKLRRAGGGGSMRGEDDSSSSSSSSSMSMTGTLTTSMDGNGIGTNTARELSPSSIELGEQISGGGFCLLYKSTWQGLTVAVKRIFDPKMTAKLRAEFENEVQMLANLQHPHIVQIIGQVSKGPSLMIITEFLPRGSLYHVLHESHVEMTKQRKLSMSLQLAHALSFMHSVGIVHRDIKSHNALADEFLRVKLCDFGMSIPLSRLAKEGPGEGGGTPNYLAPELWEGKSASVQSDMYAYGILLNEIWSQEVPWDLDPPAIRSRVLTQERPKIAPTVPREISLLIKECWAQKPNDRPVNWSKLIKTMDNFMQTLNNQ